ncbi:SAM-dependent methyltransferase [Streptomyces microflavus]|uniref:SAM-dependent methyltransferase n=1 Tax=Streptomyces microflavus TaxID=1919 RepID=UPI003332F3C0
MDLQPDKLHSARFWNYLLGGRDNFEADELLMRIPGVGAWRRAVKEVRAIAHIAGAGSQ